MGSGQVADHDSWKIAIAGECMITRPFSVHDDPRSMAVVELLRNSDLTYAHLEMNFAEFDEMEWSAKGAGGGSFMIANPKIAEELKWAGIDMMSIAHNHTYDFGASTVISTRKYCQRAGLTVAGTGRDLEEAREPVYMETKVGRAALVSASSGDAAFQWAGLPKGSWRGRPGVNPQRVSTRYVVDRQAAEQLKAVAGRLGLHTGGRGFGKDEFGIGTPDVWVDGDRFEIRSSCNPHDLAANMRSVEGARALADFVIMAHHFSIADGSRGDTPPMFAREFAHAAIDAGADIYCGHGWHRTLGIEIYKGKPIFYGLGNFFAQTDFIERVPYESYEAYGHDVDRLPTLHPAIFPLHAGRDNKLWWSGAILVVDMEGGKLRRVALHPVELGRDASQDIRFLRTTGHGPHALAAGRPLPAGPKDAELILDRYRRLCADLGTSMTIRDGIGIIDLG